MTYIFDLDGTISDDRNRRHLAEEKKWEEYNAAGAHDPINLPIVTMMVALARRPETTIEIWTGRSDDHEVATKTWLRRHGIPHHNLRMRKYGDWRAADAIKGEWLGRLLDKLEKELHGELDDIKTQVMVFDDRVPMVREWRMAGITCLDVAGNDY